MLKEKVQCLQERKEDGVIGPAELKSKVMNVKRIGSNSGTEGMKDKCVPT